MLANANRLQQINRLQRWCMIRWQSAAAEAQGLAARQAPDALYSKASVRADRWFAVVEQLARLSRLAHSAGFAFMRLGK